MEKIERIIPISDLQSKAKKYVDQVRLTEEPVIITQRGRAAAILMNYERYEGWQATLDVMSDPDWAKRLARAKRESKEGKWITLEELEKRHAKRWQRGKAA
jgi:prevent-host-death family protein